MTRPPGVPPSNPSKSPRTSPGAPAPTPSSESKAPRTSPREPSASKTPPRATPDTRETAPSKPVGPGRLQRPRGPGSVMLEGGPGQGGAERLLTGDLTWEVQDTGVRCVAAPCPTYRANRIEAGKTHPDEVVHEVDFSRAELSDPQLARVQTRLTKGLRVEGRIRWIPNRGPAGGARILEVRRVLSSP